MPIKSAAFAAAIVNHVTGRTVLTPPAQVSIALLTALPADNASAPTELVGTGYARATLANDSTTWGTDSTDGTIRNSIDVPFGIAGGAWSGIVGWAMYNTATGALLYYGPLQAAVSAATGEEVSFQPGALIVTEQ